MDAVDLFSFLQDGTKAPVRALSGLKWLSKHAALAWELSDVQAPSRIKKEKFRHPAE